MPGNGRNNGGSTSPITPLEPWASSAAVEKYFMNTQVLRIRIWNKCWLVRYLLHPPLNKMNSSSFLQCTGNSWHLRFSKKSCGCFTMSTVQMLTFNKSRRYGDAQFASKWALSAWWRPGECDQIMACYRYEWQGGVQVAKRSRSECSWSAARLGHLMISVGNLWSFWWQNIRDPSLRCIFCHPRQENVTLGDAKIVASK